MTAHPPTSRCMSTLPSGDAGYDAVAIKVRFLWDREKRGWAFYLFLFNRYFPILYEIWSRCVLEDSRKCGNTVKIHGVSFLLFLLSGQVVMIARLHVLPSYRCVVLPVIAPVVLAQLVIGLIAVFSSHASATSGASTNTPALQLCFFSVSARMGYIYIGLSLLFDFLIFLRATTVIFGSERFILASSYILRQMMRKALLYFVVIVFSHVAMLLFEVFGPDALKAAPTLAVTIISPVMVSRMVLSLARLTASSQQCRWELDHFTIDSVDSDLSLWVVMAPRNTGSSQEEPQGSDGT
ncbi:hypothetical protein BJ322DRAFT_319642 [Thelephora terrestris]|uniref:Uncharacterized protein n=1 Tax=Thelephora terrestris TaxID=56493 RepID=A0A9P6H6B3_9AGAM|nr:hypothetical protein BJ322DRAFT_319642 [Thelephora terrestris]